MIRADALPVRALGSRAVLPPDAVARLFGRDATLRDTARVAVVRMGREHAWVPVETGPALALVLGAADRDGLPDLTGLRLRGPGGVVDAPDPAPARSALVLPDGTRRAWGVPDRVTVALGPVALAVDVETGADPHVAVDRALWLGAGRPETARWLPAVDLAPLTPGGGGDATPPAPDDRVRTVARGVVTETDVRQARLHRQTIRVRPGQVVTPAARSLGREWGVFEG